MARVRRQWSLDEKARIVEAVEAKIADGETIKAAALAHGITENLFRAWRKSPAQKAARKAIVTRRKNGVNPKPPVLDGHVARASSILPAWDVVTDRKYLAAIMADGSSVILIPADNIEQAMQTLAALRG